jgi:hypothetical protein
MTIAVGLTTTVTPSVPAPFSDLLGKIAVHVAGCPDAVILAYIRDTVIHFCSYTRAWRVPLNTVNVDTGSYIYPLASPIADTEVVALLSAQKTTSTNPKKGLDIVTFEYVQKYYPSWPDPVNTGEPKLLFQYNNTQFAILPVPSSAATYVIDGFIALRPTTTATTWEQGIASEFREAIFHGVLYELMMMPKRSWSDDKMGLYHGKQWSFFKNAARAKVNKSFGPASLNVLAQPWA